MKKYYLVMYSFYSSMGGYIQDIDIIDVSYDKQPLLDKVENLITIKLHTQIESVNDIAIDEYEMEFNCNSWRIDYKVNGTTMTDYVLLKIIEREE